MGCAGAGCSGVAAAVAGIKHDSITVPAGIGAERRDHCHGKYREKCRYFLHGSVLFEIGDVNLTVGVRHKSNLVPVGGDGGIHLDAVARIGEGFLGATVDIENVELAGEVAVTVIGGALVHS